MQPEGLTIVDCADYDGADSFRGASFTGADFTGATFRDCDLRQVKITGSWLVDVRMSGLVGNVVVNDVDVTPFVEAELDGRHPERYRDPPRSSSRRRYGSSDTNTETRFSRVHGFGRRVLLAGWHPVPHDDLWLVGELQGEPGEVCEGLNICRELTDADRDGG